MGFKYLNPMMVRSYGRETPFSGSKSVICYDNLSYKICPNPDNIQRSESLKKQMKEGYYVSAKTYFLTQDQFDDPNFWIP
jgi:hypothetical protein